MTQEDKDRAIRFETYVFQRCSDMQTRELDILVDELFLQEPFSSQWSLKLLDVANLCSKLNIALPYQVFFFMVHCWFNWEPSLTQNYPTWINKNKSKGGTPISYADATRSLDPVRLRCQE